jgi:hypothetical protein
VQRRNLVKSDILIRLAQNETPQKTEVKTSSFQGVLLGINRLMSKEHQSKLPGLHLDTGYAEAPGIDFP